MYPAIPALFVPFPEGETAMKRCGTFTTLVFCLITVSYTNANISLEGLVQDGDAAPIGGAIVTLASDSTLRDTTKEDGSFILESAAGISHYVRQVHGTSIAVRESRVEIDASTPLNAPEIIVVNGKGMVTDRFVFQRIMPGKLRCRLSPHARGIYFIVFRHDGITERHYLVYTGSVSATVVKSADQSINIPHSGKRAETNADSLMVTGKGFKPEIYPVDSREKSGILVIMDRTSSPSINVKDLPAIDEMPDPLVMKDGKPVTTLEQWRLRRREMIRILEDYEYGHMPPPPGNVKATVKTPAGRITVSSTLDADYRMLHLTFGPEEKLGFDIGIFTPADAVKRFPALIYLGYSTPNKSSLGAASAALSRGYAVVTMNYSQLGADATNWHSTAFFPSYPEYDWRDFSAWAWGISRAVDYLLTDSLIDREKIMATGVSRCGQPVLLAGAVDERIALSAPVAGGMALRFSGKEMGGGLGQGITEVVDQGTYWFGPLFEKFRNQTPKLPCDQHWLPALTAPRLFIMLNSYKDEYGRAYAAVQTYLGAKPVYELLGADENIGLNFRDGGHGMTAEDWTALLDFADQKLLMKPGTKRFDVIPPKEKTP